MDGIDPSLTDTDQDAVPAVSGVVPEAGAFAVADIMLTDAPGKRGVWVSFPYAAGAPEVMRSLGGKWDKIASSWLIPAEKLDDARKRFPHVAELVRVQQAMDAANGRKPAAATRPRVLTAGPAVPRTVVGRDWVSVGEVFAFTERDAIVALGCARRGMANEWFAPDAETATQAVEAMARVREAAAIDAQRRRDKAAREAEQARAERERLEALAPEVDAVFGKGRRAVDEMEALAELAAVWPRVRFSKVETRQLNGRGETSVAVTTPSGRRMSVMHLLDRNEWQLSRQVNVVEVKAPRFPAGSGFRTHVRTTKNAKTDAYDLQPYEPPAPTPEPTPEAVPEPARAAADGIPTPAAAAPQEAPSPVPDVRPPAGPASQGTLLAIGDAMRALAVAAGVPPKHQHFAMAFVNLVKVPPQDLVVTCRKVIGASRGLLEPALAAVAMGEVAASEPAVSPALVAAGPKKRVSRKARVDAAGPARELLLALRDCLVVLNGRGDLPAADAALCSDALRSARPQVDLVPAYQALVGRHRDKLAPRLAAAALGEAAAAEPAATGGEAPAAVRRRPGPKPQGAAALTQAERNKRWREKQELTTLDLPAGLVARIREMREASVGEDGKPMSTGELLTAALAALMRAGVAG